MQCDCAIVFCLWESTIANLWELLLGQFFGCVEPTERISMGAATPIAPKKSTPMGETGKFIGAGKSHSRSSASVVRMTAKAYV